MRTLCVNLQQETYEPSCAEVFLKLSPKVQSRKPGYVFIDIESTAGILGGETKALKLALEYARTFAPKATAAIADTPYFAQILVHHKPFEISSTGEDHKILMSLPIEVLREMEGLCPWGKVKMIDHMIATLKHVGFHTFEDAFHLDLSQFRERWGDWGVLVWKRLHEREKQVITPYMTREPLESYQFFDEPVGLQQLLEFYLKKHFDYLFLRLEGLGRFCQKAEVTLNCEYSNKKYFLPITPAKPNRDKKLFLELISQKLSHLNFENPIKDFEIHLSDTAEKIMQFDFFEPRDHSEDQWQRLISLTQAMGCKMGFLQLENSYLPEESFSFQSRWSEQLQSKDTVDACETAIRIKPWHGKNIFKSPRPSLLLKSPEPLAKEEVKKITFLTKGPQERIEGPWWKSWLLKFPQRDYYFALSSTGQLLWVFQNLFDENFYLHGYFD